MRKKADKWIIRVKSACGNFLRSQNAGMGTVEVILIIVVLVGLVIVFKSQITDLVESIFSKITTQTNKI